MIGIDAILSCGHTPSPCSSFTTGYGQDRDSKRYCYDCCADRERADMIDTGRATLYLTKRDGEHWPGWRVTDWPGQLMFVANVKVGRHNIAGTRYDAWFTGPEGALWHGVTYGENTQICHCKRTKG